MRRLSARTALVWLAVLLFGALAAAMLWWKRAGSPAPYEPRERVLGGNEPPAPRVAAELESLDGAALTAAAQYAGEHHTRALLVVRHDHIVFERYWRNTSFNTLADA